MEFTDYKAVIVPLDKVNATLAAELLDDWHPVTVASVAAGQVLIVFGEVAGA